MVFRAAFLSLALIPLKLIVILPVFCHRRLWKQINQTQVFQKVMSVSKLTVESGYLDSQSNEVVKMGDLDQNSNGIQNVAQNV